MLAKLLDTQTVEHDSSRNNLVSWGNREAKGNKLPIRTLVGTKTTVLEKRKYWMRDNLCDVGTDLS